MWSSRWRVPKRSTVAALAVVALGCDTGSATIFIDQGEVIVDDTVREIAAELELEPTSEVPLSSRRPCDLPGSREGASNTVSLRGHPADDLDPLEVGAATLVDNGFELVADSGGPDLIYGRQDGMRITVDQGGGQVSIDGSTGCRPLRER